MSSNKKDKGKSKTKALINKVRVSILGGGSSSRDSVPSATTPGDIGDAHASRGNYITY